MHGGSHEDGDDDGGEGDDDEELGHLFDGSGEVRHGTHVVCVSIQTSYMNASWVQRVHADVVNDGLKFVVNKWDGDNVAFTKDVGEVERVIVGRRDTGEDGGVASGELQHDESRFVVSGEEDVHVVTHALGDNGRLNVRA